MAYPLNRKKRLLRFLHGSRQALLRLLSLTLWSAKSTAVLECTDTGKLFDVAASHGRVLQAVADDLYNAVQHTREICIPVFDVPTAFEVLTTGNYRSLPSSIQDLKGPQTLNTSRQQAIVQHMNHLIYKELNKVTLPRSLRFRSIQNGCLTLECQGLYSVKLGLYKLPFFDADKERTDANNAVKCNGTNVEYPEETHLDPKGKDEGNNGWGWLMMEIKISAGEHVRPLLRQVQLESFQQDLGGRMQVAAQTGKFNLPQVLGQPGTSDQARDVNVDEQIFISHKMKMLDDCNGDIKQEEESALEVSNNAKRRAALPLLLMHCVMMDVSARLLLDAINVRAQSLVAQWNRHMSIEPAQGFSLGIRINFWLKTFIVQTDVVHSGEDRKAAHIVPAIEFGIDSDSMVQVTSFPRLKRWPDQQLVSLGLNYRSVDVENVLLQAAIVTIHNQLSVLYAALSKMLRQSGLNHECQIHWSSPNNSLPEGSPKEDSSGIQIPSLVMHSDDVSLLRITRHPWTGRLILRPTLSNGGEENVEMLMEIADQETRLNRQLKESMIRFVDDRPAMHALGDAAERLTALFRKMIVRSRMTTLLYVARNLSLHFHQPTRSLLHAMKEATGCDNEKAGSLKNQSRHRVYLALPFTILPRGLPLVTREVPSATSSPTPISSQLSMPITPYNSLPEQNELGITSSNVGGLPLDTSNSGRTPAFQESLATPHSLSCLIGLEFPLPAEPKFAMVVSLCDDRGFPVKVFKNVAISEGVGNDENKSLTPQRMLADVFNSRIFAYKHKALAQRGQDLGKRKREQSNNNHGGVASPQKEENPSFLGDATDLDGLNTNLKVRLESGRPTKKIKIAHRPEGEKISPKHTSNYNPHKDILQQHLSRVVAWVSGRMLWEKLQYELQILKIPYEEVWQAPQDHTLRFWHKSPHPAINILEPPGITLEGQRKHSKMRTGADGSNNFSVTAVQFIVHDHGSVSNLDEANAVAEKVDIGKWSMYVRGSFFHPCLANKSETMPHLVSLLRKGSELHVSKSGIQFTYGPNPENTIIEALADLHRLLYMQQFLESLQHLTVGRQALCLNRNLDGDTSTCFAIESGLKKPSLIPVAPSDLAYEHLESFDRKMQPTVRGKRAKQDAGSVYDSQLPNGTIESDASSFGSSMANGIPRAYKTSDMNENVQKDRDQLFCVPNGISASKELLVPAQTNESHGQHISTINVASKKAEHPVNVKWNWPSTATITLREYSCLHAMLSCELPPSPSRQRSSSTIVTGDKRKREEEKMDSCVNIVDEEMKCDILVSWQRTEHVNSNAYKEGLQIPLARCNIVATNVAIPEIFYQELTAMVESAEIGIFLDTLAISLCPLGILNSFTTSQSHVAAALRPCCAYVSCPTGPFSATLNVHAGSFDWGVPGGRISDTVDHQVSLDAHSLLFRFDFKAGGMLVIETFWLEHALKEGGEPPSKVRVEGLKEWLRRFWSSLIQRDSQAIAGPLQELFIKQKLHLRAWMHASKLSSFLSFVRKYFAESELPL